MLLPFFSVVLAALSPVLAQDSASNDDQASTITAAPPSCESAEAQSKYEACASSIDKKVDLCSNDNDYSCACSAAVAGFQCLTSHCIGATTAICGVSYAVNGFCAAIGQSSAFAFTDYSCPSDILAALTSVLPSDVINSIFPQETGDSSSQRQSSTTASSTGANDVSNTEGSVPPSKTGGASGLHRALVGLKVKKIGEGDPVSGFLAVGICVAVAVSGMAALFL